jgi:predicted RNA-binding Zn-ribbon protein involved in translation (DUF1610 family)
VRTPLADGGQAPLQIRHVFQRSHIHPTARLHAARVFHLRTKSCRSDDHKGRTPLASTILECPHCGAEKIGFHLTNEVEATIKPTGLYRKYRVTMVCPNCEEMVIGVFEATAINAATSQRTPVSSAVDPLKLGWTLANSYPKPQPSKCPSDTPEDLKRIFLQAANALKRQDPDASGAMSRKVLDVSTQQLLGEESKNYKTIHDRINALASANRLTPDLKDWAHQLRIGGNDAAHDAAPFTQEEADELLDFAELYLTYVYTLPERLKKRRAKKTPV